MADKLKTCPYGDQCYRKNPIHFSEFSHPHLDKIYSKGLDPATNNYAIPDEYFMSAELIETQLKLLEKLFPKASCSGRGTSEIPTSSNIDGDTIRGRRLDGKAVKPDTAKRSKSPVGSTSTDYALSSNASSSSPTDKSKLSKKPKITRNIKDYIPVVLEKGHAAEKLERAAPYNFFLTAITDSKLTHHEPLTITLQEILDESLGELESSVQINFMVEIGWLLGHYYFAGVMGTPLLVIYGDETPELINISKTHPEVTAVKVNMPTPFATSHAKVMLLGYTDGGMRIVISTANLYEDDWHNRTQGIWISPKLPALAQNVDTTAGESPTNFRQDLMLYLVEYKIPKLQPWIARIRKTDFSSINVFFIGSTPGGFREGARGFPWGHARVGELLQKYCTTVDARVPVICQSSSIGSLGPNIQTWIQQDFLNSLRKHSGPPGLSHFPPFKMIYPSFSNVNGSHDGLIGGGCLPYGANTNDKQPWLRGHLFQWCSKQRYRSQAMPHIKSYTRINLENQSIYWFMLTSANLSKAAWGAFNKNVNILPCLRIYNYEAGVLFLPRFVTGEETFPLGHVRDGIPPFPLPYDVPLTPFAPDDKPFLMDYLHQ
ncbi:PREDICTED: probable tyrosyl-DNA phosphodiesterase [Rhagoletis zephyria]|uniref:probable tyrosyl-DNA phosphodiesterase n=1 Tax=Rhagoletis zephyria TaxID=28612 RepID=UPI000811A2FD|nr:PREDICTED: probable tyrosyl-DNA phosphodiesterase [Rhagoletis zephyria]